MRYIIEVFSKNFYRRICTFQIRKDDTTRTSFSYRRRPHWGKQDRFETGEHIHTLRKVRGRPKSLAHNVHRTNAFLDVVAFLCIFFFLPNWSFNLHLELELSSQQSIKLNVSMTTPKSILHRHFFFISKKFFFILRTHIYTSPTYKWQCLTVPTL